MPGLVAAASMMVRRIKQLSPRRVLVLPSPAVVSGFERTGRTTSRKVAWRRLCRALIALVGFGLDSVVEFLALVTQAQRRALRGQDGTVEYAAVLGDRGQRQRPAADLHGDEVVADRPRLPRRHTRARAQDGVQRLAAATGDDVGDAGARGEPLVVVLVAVE